MAAPSDAFPELMAIRQLLGRAWDISSVVELPGGKPSIAAALQASGFEVRPADLPVEAVRAAEALPLGTKSVDCLVNLGPAPRDADSRVRRLREYGRIARWVLVTYDEPRHPRREFEDAGLRMAGSIAGYPNGAPGRYIVLAEAGFTHPEAAALRLRDTEFADAALVDKVGEGKRSVVYRARWKGRDVGVKVYKPAAIASHARRHPVPLAEFEHGRNRAFFDAPGLARYVAEPLGRVVAPGFQMSMQEWVDGELYYFAKRAHADYLSPRFREELAELVRLSHAAGLYDIDLHAMNVMVDRRTGLPKLFDFNQIPFHERPPNPFAWLGLKLGLLGKGSRDLRKLAEFDDFGRIERRLLKFYGPRGDGEPARDRARD